ncbi:T-complex protein 1 subunit eta [Tupaia chinensis]|uniref:T-complex protein 1 subunit eta n=1 Tax=Tupaia chinensis TaxID=246437 RepID=L9L9N0_TUPCH|nr:T-complex protein 1 subunit eta [Tupaia chinensis]
MPCFVEQVEVAIEALSVNIPQLFEENEFIHASCLVYDGVQDIRKAMLMIRIPEELEDNSDFQQEDYDTSNVINSAKKIVEAGSQMDKLTHAVAEQYPDSALKTLVDIVKSQDVEVGNGTTSMTLLAAEFLKQVKPYVEQGLHPQIIIRASRTATQLAVNKIREIAVTMKKQDKVLAECLRRI